MCLHPHFHEWRFEYLKVRNIIHSLDNQLNVTRNFERFNFFNVACYLQHKVQAPYSVHTNCHEKLKAKRNYQCQKHCSCCWVGNRHNCFSFVLWSCLWRNFGWRCEEFFNFLPWRLWNKENWPQNINMEYIRFFSNVNIKIIDEIHLDNYLRFSKFSYLPAT